MQGLEGGCTPKGYSHGYAGCTPEGGYWPPGVPTPPGVPPPGVPGYKGYCPSGPVPGIYCPGVLGVSGRFGPCPGFSGWFG